MSEELKKQPCESAWGTTKEIKWLETIGDTANKSLENQTNEPKIKFLSGYIKSCKNRIEWGTIDKVLCLKRANEILGFIRNGY
jgi:hypothetical protein